MADERVERPSLNIKQPDGKTPGEIPSFTSGKRIPISPAEENENLPKDKGFRNKLKRKVRASIQSSPAGNKPTESHTSDKMRTDSTQSRSRSKNHTKGSADKIREQHPPSKPLNRLEGGVMNKLFVWGEHARQSADDQTIVDEVSTLFFLSEQHVKNYYVNDNAQIWDEAMLELETLSLPHLPAPVINLLKQARFQDTIIQHCLVYIMIKSISIDDSTPYPSLLPSEFTGLLRTLRKSTAEPRKIPRMDEALSTYRMNCVYLWPNIKDDQIWLICRNNVIEGLASSFTRAFRPWENGARDSAQCLSNLTGLLERASTLGILLFSQTSVFEFNWQLPPDASRASEIAIAPRLLKVYNEHAQRLDPAKHMLKLQSEHAGVEITFAMADPVDNAAKSTPDNTTLKMNESPVSVLAGGSNDNNPSTIPELAQTNNKAHGSSMPARELQNNIHSTIPGSIQTDNNTTGSSNELGTKAKSTAVGQFTEIHHDNRSIVNDANRPGNEQPIEVQPRKPLPISKTERSSNVPPSVEIILKGRPSQ